MGEESEMFMSVKKETERDRGTQRELVCVCVCVRACVRASGCGGRKARFLTDCDRQKDGIPIGRG